MVFIEPFNLSPSLIGYYFFFECPRYLRYSATPDASAREQKLPVPVKNRGISAEALLDAGLRWEEAVVRRLGDRVSVADGEGVITKRQFSAEETVERLRSLETGSYLYQTTLIPPPDFLRGFGIPDDLCTIHFVRPDLIECAASDDGAGRLRVIDVKGSQHVKGSHRIQVTLYAMMLDARCRAERLGLSVDMDEGAVWLIDADDPEPFALRPSTRIVTDFLRSDLRPILEAPLDEVGWHFYYRCEWCVYYPACKREARSVIHPSVSQIPYLTPGGRRFLREASWPGGTPINTLYEFHDFIHRDDAATILAQSGSLRNQRNRLAAAADALFKLKPIPIGGSSLSLPVSEGVRLAITLQRDPTTGKVYAAGFRRFGGQRAYPTSHGTQVFVAPEPEECDAVGTAFLQALHAELASLDTFNRNRSGGEYPLSLQTYVFDTHEEQLFTELVFEALGDPALAPIALDLLFYYQDTSLSAADSHPHDEVPFPIVSLTSVIQQLLALPLEVSYRLADVAKKLPSRKFDYQLPIRDQFWYDYSNMLRSDAILNAWNAENPQRRTSRVDEIREEIERRLMATTMIVDGLRERVPAGSLFARARPFAFPDTWPFRHPEISRLAFIVRYESLVGALETRRLRARPLPDRLEEGISIPLVREDDDRWRLEYPLDRHLFEKHCGGERCLLTDAGDDRRALTHDDYALRERSFTMDPAIAYVWVTADGQSDLVTHAHLRFGSHSIDERYPAGSAVVVHPLFKDFTSRPIIDELQRIDAQNNPDLLQLLRHPIGCAVPVHEEQRVKDRALQEVDRFELSRSQRGAFHHLLENRLTLLWGPPGTGKTYCLKAMIAALARGRSGCHSRMRILITAFTHDTVNQLLSKVQEALEAWGAVHAEDVEIYKLEKYASSGAPPPADFTIPILSVKNLDRGHGLRNLPVLIVGGTMHAFRKIQNDERQYDLLVVDEASQVKWGELSLALHHLVPGGRILLAGDDLQLPPIIQGHYPEPEDDLPGLFDSVFAYLRERDKKESPRYTKQLLENRRMNYTLSRFPAVTLYSTEYTSVDESIGHQALELERSPPGTGNAHWGIIEWLLDPAFPLVLVVVENVQATVENVVEAELVAAVAWWLCLRLGGDDSRAFLANRVCVVSPHHVQIRAIQSQVRSLTEDWDAMLIDTVEKMQGKERDTVLVSYGVSDAETALSEAEFIYGLNRLNVAVTRARKKCVVFLPRPLLRPTYQLLESAPALEGLSHMLALQEFCRENGEEASFAWNSEVLEAPVMLTAFRARWVPPHGGQSESTELL